MKISNVMRVVAFMVCSIFTTTTIAWSAPQSVYSIKVPEKMGKIVERYRASSQINTDSQHGLAQMDNPRQSATQDALNPRTSAERSRMVVLIQDAHTSRDAQKNIKQLVETLTKDTGAQFVGLEGGTEDIEAQDIHRFDNQAAKEEVALYYLNKGILSGAEAASLCVNDTVRFSGIENSELFATNYATFLAHSKKVKAVERILERLDVSFDNMKSHVLNGALAECDARYKAFLENQKSLLEYLTYIENVAVRVSVSVLDYVHIASFMETIQKQNSEDKDATSAALSSIDYDAVIKEVHQLTRDSEMALAQTERERSFLNARMLVHSIKSFITLTATSDEVKRVYESLDNGAFDRLVAYCNDNKISINDAALRSAIESARGFYRDAFNRDEALVKTQLEKANSADTSVMVTGGFHTKGITEYLRNNNVSYVVVTPQLETITQDLPYWEKMNGSLINQTLFNHITVSYLTSALLKDGNDRIVTGEILNDVRSKLIAVATAYNLNSDEAKNLLSVVREGENLSQVVNEFTGLLQANTLNLDEAQIRSIIERMMELYQIAGVTFDDVENADAVLKDETLVDKVDGWLGAYETIKSFDNQTKTMIATLINGLKESQKKNSVPPASNGGSQAAVQTGDGKSTLLIGEVFPTLLRAMSTYIQQVCAPLVQWVKRIVFASFVVGFFASAAVAVNLSTLESSITVPQGATFFELAKKHDLPLSLAKQNEKGQWVYAGTVEDRGMLVSIPSMKEGDLFTQLKAGAKIVVTDARTLTVVTGSEKGTKEKGSKIAIHPLEEKGGDKVAEKPVVLQQAITSDYVLAQNTYIAELLKAGYVYNWTDQNVTTENGLVKGYELREKTTSALIGKLLVIPHDKGLTLSRLCEKLFGGSSMKGIVWDVDKSSGKTELIPNNGYLWKASEGTKVLPYEAVVVSETGQLMIQTELEKVMKQSSILAQDAILFKDMKKITQTTVFQVPSEYASLVDLVKSHNIAVSSVFNNDGSIKETSPIRFSPKVMKDRSTLAPGDYYIIHPRDKEYYNPSLVKPVALSINTVAAEKWDIDISLLSEGVVYTMQKGESLEQVLREKFSFSDDMIQKVLTNEGLYIAHNPYIEKMPLHIEKGVPVSSLESGVSLVIKAGFIKPGTQGIVPIDKANFVELVEVKDYAYKVREGDAAIPVFDMFNLPWRSFLTRVEKDGTAYYTYKGNAHNAYVYLPLEKSIEGPMTEEELLLVMRECHTVIIRKGFIRKEDLDDIAENPARTLHRPMLPAVIQPSFDTVDGKTLLIGVDGKAGFIHADKSTDYLAQVTGSMQYGNTGVSVKAKTIDYGTGETETRFDGKLWEETAYGTPYLGVLGFKGDASDFMTPQAGYLFPGISLGENLIEAGIHVWGRDRAQDETMVLGSVQAAGPLGIVHGMTYNSRLFLHLDNEPRAIDASLVVADKEDRAKLTFLQDPFDIAAKLHMYGDVFGYKVAFGYEAYGENSSARTMSAFGFNSYQDRDDKVFANVRVFDGSDFITQGDKIIGIIGINERNLGIILDPTNEEKTFGHVGATYYVGDWSLEVGLDQQIGGDAIEMTGMLRYHFGEVTDPAHRTSAENVTAHKLKNIDIRKQVPMRIEKALTPDEHGVSRISLEDLKKPESLLPVLNGMNYVRQEFGDIDFTATVLTAEERKNLPHGAENLVIFYGGDRQFILDINSIRVEFNQDGTIDIVRTEVFDVGAPGALDIIKEYLEARYDIEGNYLPSMTTVTTEMPVIKAPVEKNPISEFLGSVFGLSMIAGSSMNGVRGRNGKREIVITDENRAKVVAEYLIKVAAFLVKFGLDPEILLDDTDPRVVKLSTGNKLAKMQSTMTYQKLEELGAEINADGESRKLRDAIVEFEGGRVQYFKYRADIATVATPGVVIIPKEFHDKDGKLLFEKYEGSRNQFAEMQKKLGVAREVIFADDVQEEINKQVKREINLENITVIGPATIVAPIEAQNRGIHTLKFADAMEEKDKFALGTLVDWYTMGMNIAIFGEIEKTKLDSKVNGLRENGVISAKNVYEHINKKIIEACFEAQRNRVIAQAA